MANISKLGHSAHQAVDSATRKDSAGGKKVTAGEWKQISEAVDRDLDEATMMPIGAPFPRDASSALLAIGYVNLHEQLVSKRSENAASEIFSALASIGPHTAKVVDQWKAGNRSLDPADKALGKILKKVDQSVEHNKTRAARSKGGMEAAQKKSLELSPKLSDKEGMEAINKAYSGFNLGED